VRVRETECVEQLLTTVKEGFLTSKTINNKIISDKKRYEETTTQLPTTTANTTCHPSQPFL
jgi:hypothetical protein